MNLAETKAFGVALFSILLGAVGQFLFRVGMLRYGKVSAGGIWGQLLRVIFTPAIFAGFVCFGVSSVLWLTVISRWELSYAYPMVALGYVLAVFFGWLFLHESLTLPKILGIILILGGIAILGWFGKAQ
ncbi:EamA domain protein [Acididesulfobacillus acetoxydans]|uniref:EamA domain protein n=1 Tax=Acididesulfobacillus acetoxydans TaxID=1561005 RepID=A0A8S0W5J2_9FIRM|nr:EamA family transporter [Acididesulfobacillus acetoxydans]CAA7603198.1 EamA domain protein [Acididesulfobacillus acetoxydans]